MYPDGAPQPSPRGYHAAVCLDYNTNNPQLLVIGGYDGIKILSDVWSLDVQAQSWQQVYFIIIVRWNNSNNYVIIYLKPTVKFNYLNNINEVNKLQSSKYIIIGTL